jgi:PHD/YefM family antitoxin component YafN of YafNO toxin-antitoxin module
MIIPNSTTVTELRRKSASILKTLADEKLLLLIQNSKPRGALVDLEYLKMLQEAYEDYLDTLAFDQAVDQPTISWEKHKEKSARTK